MRGMRAISPGRGASRAFRAGWLTCKPPLGRLRKPHIEAALAVWAYSEEPARYIFGDALGDPLADQILVLLRRAGRQGMTRNEIRDSFQRHRTAGEIAGALAVLLDNGFAYSRPEQTSGR
jgi:hypothetical protein